VCEELLVTVREAARRLRLGRSATYLLIQRGELPSFKIGGSRRVAVADLREFVDRLRAEVSGEVGR
jgi:excisionase family DNA binding protein